MNPVSLRRLAAASFLLLLAVSGTGCKCGPCIAPGEYELFARRVDSSGNLDGGSLTCPVEFTASLDLHSEAVAHFTTDSGLSGDCTEQFIDYRPQYDCQVFLRCTAVAGNATVSFVTFAFTRPENDFIDGFGGVGDSRGGLGFQFRDAFDAGCDADYQWAAAPRRRP